MKTQLTLLTAIMGLIVLAVIFELVRRRQLREKYAMLWLAVGLLVVPLSFFPRLLDSVAGRVGVASGVSLVLFLGFMFLLLVAVHLSWEVSRLEEETRALAEAMGLLRADMDAKVARIERAAAAASGPMADGHLGVRTRPGTAELDPVTRLETSLDQ